MQTFSLDLSAKRVIPLLFVKQRDVGSKICIKLTDNEEDYVVPDDVTWSVWYSGVSGEGNYDKIDGRDAVVVNGSTATVELIYQMLDNPGAGKMCLVMNSADGTQLGLWNIPYWVEAIPGANSKAATVYYQAFMQAREGAENAAAQSEAAAGRAEVAAEDAKAAAKEAANKKPQDVVVTASFDAVVNDTISTGTADVSAFEIATAISKGATVTLIDDDNRVYKYCGYRLEPNYSNAFFEAQEIDANGITTYRATINNEGQASRTKYTHEYATTATDPDRHAQFFDITDDGVISLKDNYRGACPANRSDYDYAVSNNGVGAVGSDNAKLPKLLVIPEKIGNIAVNAFAPAMFLYNYAIEDLEIPNTVTEIPERFCDNAIGLTHLYGTENIETIGKTAFQRTHLEKVCFPSLKSIGGITAFGVCGNLVYADIGNVTSLPDKTFKSCVNLHRIKNTGTISSIGGGCFFQAGNLKNVDFLSGLTSIGVGAFLTSRKVYDWDSLTGCSFGTNATSKKIDPNNIWDNCTFTACKNPLPTLLCQNNPAWADKNIGTTNKPYNDGCAMFAYMHIYCGLHNLVLTSVEEFEEILNEIDPNPINTYVGNTAYFTSFLTAMGLSVTEINYKASQANAQSIYDALAQGKYVILDVPSDYNTTSGHVVIAYGVNELGELLIADSGDYNLGKNYPAATYTVSPKNLLGTYGAWVVSL